MTDTPRTAAGQDFVDPPTDIAYLTHAREQRLAIALAIEAEAADSQAVRLNVAVSHIKALMAPLAAEYDRGIVDNGTRRRAGDAIGRASAFLAARKEQP